MTIGNIICELRKERGISQQKLASATGLNQATIAKIEINRNEATAETIRKLATFFDVSADYLLGLEDDFGTRAPAPMSFTASPSEKLTEKEKALLEAFKKLLPETQDFILRTAQSLSDKDRSKLLK